MSGSVIESSEREECGGNPITRKEPADKKLRGHVHRRGWGGTGMRGVQNTENYGSGIVGS